MYRRCLLQQAPVHVKCYSAFGEIKDKNFEKNYIIDTRHSGYYVFISESKVDVNNLSSLTLVYHEENPYPPEQSIIQFPDGRQGQHLYIILNKPHSVLDICEVEIWGI